MDLTKKNFKENLVKLANAISDANFIAIDCELTGLHMAGVRIHGLDTPESRYHKLRQGSMQFQIIQFGVCTFEYNKSEDRYDTRPFNCYIFPHPFSHQAADVRFSVQSSSIDFLTSHGFDFNKAFKEGIPYLPPSEEQRLLSSLQHKHHNLQTSPGPHPSPTSPHTPHSANHNTIQALSPQNTEFVAKLRQQIKEFKHSDDATMSLEPSNGFLRKLTYQTVQTEFPQDFHLEAKTNSNNMKYIEVMKVSGEPELKELEEKKRRGEYEEIDDAVGFTKVIKLLSESGKLIVGHNMLLDLLHTVDKFCCPLPESYLEFKTVIHNIFPRLLDTKVLATTSSAKKHIQHSGLEELRRTLHNAPFKPPSVVVAEGFPSYHDDTNPVHQAGYDAYVTGQCFLTMAAFLGSMSKSPEEPITTESEVLQPFINKVHLMKVFDIPYLNLAGEDAEVVRNHVFHIEFPVEWKSGEINQLFSPFGNVHITWIDDSSAFVALVKKDQAKQVLRNVKRVDGLRVQSYHHYQHSAPHTPHAPPPHTPLFPHTPSNTPLCTPTNLTTPKLGGKRKVLNVDPELPRKRTRSSESTARRSCTTIPEVEEEIHLETPDSVTSKETEDLGSPVKTKEPVVTGDKLFAEVTWD